MTQAAHDFDSFDIDPSRSHWDSWLDRFWHFYGPMTANDFLHMAEITDQAYELYLTTDLSPREVAAKVRKARSNRLARIAKFALQSIAIGGFFFLIFLVILMVSQ